MSKTLHPVMLGIGFTAALFANPAAFAAGPGSELSSGVYVTRPLLPSLSSADSNSLSVGVFAPVLHDSLAGVTEQLFFDCVPGTGLVSLGGQSQFADYIRSALIEQLALADIYAAGSAVQLTGELQQVELFLDQVAGQQSARGTWQIQLALQSSLGGGEVFAIDYSYPIANYAKYCEEMASQFMKGVQALMSEILGSEEFAELLRRRDET
jgi:hypothetical protein